MRPLWLIPVCVLALTAADPGWKTKPPSQWTEADASQLLTASPWVREIRAGLARRQSEDELRMGGQMGQPKGPGYDNVDPKGSGPKLPSIKSVFVPSDDRSPRSRVSSIPA